MVIWELPPFVLRVYFYSFLSRHFSVAFCTRLLLRWNRPETVINMAAQQQAGEAFRQRVRQKTVENFRKAYVTGADEDEAMKLLERLRTKPESVYSINVSDLKQTSKDQSSTSSHQLSKSTIK